MESNSFKNSRRQSIILGVVARKKLEDLLHKLNKRESYEKNIYLHSILGCMVVYTEIRPLKLYIFNKFKFSVKMKSFITSIERYVVMKTWPTPASQKFV